MSEIVFGQFHCRGKVYKVTVKGKEVFRLTFYDDEENKLEINVSEQVFKNIQWGDALPWSMVKRQGTLNGK